MYKTLYQKLSNVLELTHSHENRSNISSMEGIRGIAAFLVFIEHYVVALEAKIGINQQYWIYDLFLWLKNIGNVGVELFFVLSGYLIYGSIISKKKPFIPYLCRRANRIYPTFLSVFFLYIVLAFLIPEYNKIPTDMSTAVSYILQNIFFMAPLFSDIEPLIRVSWSLNYEVFFYLLMPAIVSLFRLRTWHTNRRIQFFLLLSVLGFVYSYYCNGPIRMLMFVAGILLFEIISNGVDKKTTPYLGLLFFVFSLVSIVLLMIYNIPHGSWWRTIIIYLGFFMLCYECFSWQSPSARIFSFTPLRWLGNMSYSYYLIHGLAVKSIVILSAQFYFTNEINDVFVFLIFGAFVCILTLIPALLLFVYIEKPFSLANKRK